MSVRLVKIPNPLNLDINVKADLDYCHGKTLESYLSGQIPNTPGVEWVACKNGLPVDPEYWRVTAVDDGDKIAVCPKQCGAAAAAVAGYVVGISGVTAASITLSAAYIAVYAAVYIAIGFVVAFGASAIAGALGQGSGSGGGSNGGNESYGWDALHQTFTEGGAIPLIFGEVKTSGQAINQFVRTTPVIGSRDEQESATETMFLLNALCDHEIDEVSDFEISGQPSAYYSDCTITTRLGTLNDAPIPGFGELVTQTDVGSVASWGNPVVAQTQGDCEKVEVVISAPEGLYRIRDSKGLWNWTVDYKVEYRAIGATSWILAESGTWRGECQTALKKVVSIDGLALGRYEVQLTRMQEDETSFRNRNKISLECLQEILKEELIYPGLAKYGVQVVANDQLSAGVPVVTCIAKRNTVQIYDVDQGAWVSKSAKNPAWICYELLQYHNVPTSRIIWQDFKDWADYCDTDVGDGEKRHEINVLISGGTAWDQLQKIAQMGDAAIVRRNTKYGVFVDMPADSVDHLFTMGNIVEGTFNIQYLPKKDRAAAVEIEYNDIDRDHTRQVVTVISDDYVSSSKNREKATVSFEAAMTQSAAIRHGVRVINSNKYLVRVVTFDCWVDAFAAVVGDIFEFQHESINYLKSDIGGVITNAGNDDGDGAPYVEIDRPVKMEFGFVYKLKVRLGDDSFVEKTVDSSRISDFSVEHSILPLTQPWTNIPTHNDIYAFGRADTYLKKYRITDATRKNEHMRTIIGLEYVDELYTDNDGYVIEEPEWDPEYDTAVNVSANEILLPSKGGVFISQLNVSWHRAFSTARNTWGVWLEDQTAETSAKKIGTAQGQQFTIESGLILEHTYKVYVCADSFGLVDSGDNTATVTILGKEAPPSDVTGFTAAWDPIRRIAALGWSHITDPDLSMYVVKVGSDFDAGNTIAETSANRATYNMSGLTSGNITFGIKAVDSTGNYSEAATYYTMAFDSGSTELSPPTGLVWSSDSNIGTDGTDTVMIYAYWEENISDDFDHFLVQVTDNVSGKVTQFFTVRNDYQFQALPNRSYTIAVAAADKGNNLTAFSAGVTHTTVKDESPPAAPTALSANGTFTNIILSWSHSGEADLDHFEVYRADTNSSAAATVIGSAVKTFSGVMGMFSDTPPTNGIYYYWVKGVDSSGNKSDFSPIGSASAPGVTAEVGPGSITATEIADDAITTPKIYAGAVGTDQLAANAVIASKINVTTLSAITANVGTVTAGLLRNAAGTTYLNLSNGTMSLGGLLTFNGSTLSIGSSATIAGSNASTVVSNASSGATFTSSDAGNLATLNTVSDSYITSVSGNKITTGTIAGVSNNSYWNLSTNKMYFSSAAELKFGSLGKIKGSYSEEISFQAGDLELSSNTSHYLHIQTDRILMYSDDFIAIGTGSPNEPLYLQFGGTTYYQFNGYDFKALANNSRNCGSPNYQWKGVYAYEYWDGSSQFHDLKDDLCIMAEFKPRKAVYIDPETGQKTVSEETEINPENASEYMDLLSLPKWMTNYEEVKVKLKEDNGDLLSDEDIEDLIEDRHEAGWMLCRNVGAFNDLTSGAVRQLDGEMIGMCEAFASRISELEKKIKRLEAA